MPIPEQRINALLRRLEWNRADCAIEPTPLGSTNESYLCTYRGEKYVLRLGTNQAGILSINRRAEEAALKIVSDLHCGAPLVYYDIESGNMVTRFIQGRELTGEDFNDPRCLREVIKVLKTVHSRQTAFQFDFYGDVERKIDFIKQHNIPLHPKFSCAYEKYQACMDRNEVNPKLHYGLCHGDPFPNNFILSDDGQTYLIDYEFSGMGDVFYDLACIAPGLEPQNQEELLRLYFGACTAPLLQKLHDYIIINLMWNGTWAYVKSYDVPADVFDFVKFGDLHVNLILKDSHPTA